MEASSASLMGRATFSLLTFDHWVEGLSETEGYWVRVSERRKRVPEMSKHIFLLSPSHLLPFLPSCPPLLLLGAKRAKSRNVQGPASYFSSGKLSHSSDSMAVVVELTSQFSFGPMQVRWMWSVTLTGLFKTGNFVCVVISINLELPREPDCTWSQVSGKHSWETERSNSDNNLWAPGCSYT